MTGIKKPTKTIHLPGQFSCNEAPIMFKRNGYYYIFYSLCCCYCKMGSPIFAIQSRNPLGPYYPAGVLDSIHYHRKQPNHVFEVNTPDGPEYILSGTRWRSHPYSFGKAGSYTTILNFTDNGEQNFPKFYYCSTSNGIRWLLKD